MLCLCATRFDSVSAEWYGLGVDSQPPNMAQVKEARKTAQIHPDYARIGMLTKEAMARRVRGGGVAGIAPRGYRNLPGTGGRVDVHPTEARIIRAAFRMAAEGGSLRQVSSLLFQRGIATSTGRQVSPSAVQHMLTNPFYVGTVTLGASSFPGTHVPLVSAELFADVQRRFKR